GGTQPFSKIETFATASGGAASAYTGEDIGVIEAIGQFTFKGCDGAAIMEPLSNQSPIPIPRGTEVEHMMFVESEALSIAGSLERLFLKRTNNDEILTLEATPGTFKLLAPHQDVQFFSQRPFFYQDDTRTFVVVPRQVGVDLQGYFTVTNQAAFLAV